MSAEQVRIIRRYLSALDAQKPGRGTKRAAEAIANRLLKIDELLVSADPISRLHLTQERIDLDAEHVRLSNGHEADLEELERAFVKVARTYGDRTGVTYAAWRQVGVDSDVLEKAGIVRMRPHRPGPARPEPAPTAPAQPEAAPQAAKEAAPVKKATQARKAPAKKAPAKKTAAAAKKKT